jgi:hypothetical protein
VAELPREDLFGPNAWKIFVFHGSAAGLPPAPSSSFVSTDLNEGRPALAVGAGDVNGDGFDDVLVGAPGANGGTGKVYLHFGSAAGLHAVPDWTSTGDAAAGSAFGEAVSGAGDVNGDGFDDLLVGAPAFGGSGKAYVYYGTPYGPDTAAGWTSQGDDQPGARFGQSVAAAGNVDGLGAADILVGAPGFGGIGKAYLYSGGAAGLAITPGWTSTGDAAPDAAFGTSVASAGDVDGDGDDEVIVGAPGVAAGKAFVYFGAAAGLSPAPDWSATGDGTPGDEFGACVRGAGDVDGDGFDDVVAGAPGFGGETGKAYLYGGAGAAASLTSTVGASSGGKSCGALGIEALILALLLRRRQSCVRR